MARKGTIIKDSSGGTDGTTTVSTSSGGATAVAGAATIMYSITDDKTQEQFDFEQPYGKGLLFHVGDVVRFETITVPGSTKETVVRARRFQAGTVASLTDNSNGYLTEKITGKKIAFYQTYLKEQGITVGADVKYDLVLSPMGTEIAVNLEANV